jgi:hypothetical protein
MFNDKPYPHIIVIGAQKCGTTSLHMSLIRHSCIKGAVDPDSKRPIKEMDFFFKHERWAKGADWYWAHYNHGTGVSLDSSPNYLLDVACYRRIREVAPNAKLIITLRNPVGRAYSQYNHYVQELPLSQSYDWDYRINFSDNVSNELYKNRNTDSCFYGMVYKGIYIKQIQLLLQYFDRSQLYITVMEKWKHRYQEELNNILHFMGLEEEKLPDEIKHKREYFVEPRNEEACHRLAEFYKPYNESLFEFLGYDVPEWSETF